MKKVIDMVAKPRMKDFLVGLRIIENIEGRLRSELERKQRMTRVDFEKRDSQLNMISEMHQKFGTLSWYNPLCTGKMAVTTDCKFSMDPNQGAQSIRLTPTTMKAYLIISPKNFSRLYL